jgi:hypothetical protein
VYVVYRPSSQTPVFLSVSPAGHFQGQDPTVDLAVLRATWTDGVPVIYIGKAPRLRSRLRQFRRFGEGVPIGHHGGRYIWQLEDVGELLVAWKTTTEDPARVESILLRRFVGEHGRLPFANLNGGAREAATVGVER